MFEKNYTSFIFTILKFNVIIENQFLWKNLNLRFEFCIKLKFII